MKILISGSDKPHAIEKIYHKHLTALGVETNIFAGQTLLANFIEKNIFNRIQNRLGFMQAVYEQISQTLENEVEEQKPDVLLVFKGMEITPETIKRIKEKGVFVTNYNPDHPFIFTGRGSGNKNVTNSFPLYNVHFCYSKLLQEQIEREYKIKTAFLPFGYELSEEEFANCQAETEIPKLCFLGNPDNERTEFIKKLVAEGIEITIYGHHWNRYLTSNTKIELKPATYQLGYWKTLQKYRIQLNILRKHNVDSHNMRTFEVPAIGGVQLADDTTEHRLFFEPEKEIFLFKNIADCVEKIKYIQSLPLQTIQEIRLNARKRSIASGYSYFNRAKDVRDVLQKM